MLKPSNPKPGDPKSHVEVSRSKLENQAASPVSNDPVSKDLVVLVHGLGSHPVMMARLARRLAKHRFSTLNWGYSWNSGLGWLTSIEQLADACLQSVRQLESQYPHAAMHFVTHSMGSIILRRVLVEHVPARRGRIVMLSPPNAGSHVARRLARSLGRWLVPLQELSDAPESYVNQLPSLNGFDVGIVAAADDAVVDLSATHLEGQRDHIILPGRHGLLPLRRDTAAEVRYFLRRGVFRHTRQAIACRSDT